jgi:hypothetical protein
LASALALELASEKPVWVEPASEVALVSARRGWVDRAWGMASALALELVSEEQVLVLVEVCSQESSVHWWSKQHCSS